MQYFLERIGGGLVPPPPSLAPRESEYNKLLHELGGGRSFAVRRRRRDVHEHSELQSAAGGGGELPASRRDAERSQTEFGGPPSRSSAGRDLLSHSLAPADIQYSIAHKKTHCEKCGKSDGRGGSARSDRAKSEVLRDRSASDAARARSFSPCLTFWYFWVKPKVR